MKRVLSILIICCILMGINVTSVMAEGTTPSVPAISIIQDMKNALLAKDPTYNYFVLYGKYQSHLGIEKYRYYMFASTIKMKSSTNITNGQHNTCSYDYNITNQVYESFSTNVYNMTISEFFGGTVPSILWANYDVMSEDDSENLYDSPEDNTYTNEPELPIMVTADSEGITVHNLDPIPSEVNQLYALKLQSSLETTEVINIYFKETYIPYESLSKPINAGTYIYRVVHIENPANTSAYTELGRGIVKIPSEIISYHVPRPKNMYVYTTMNTANPSASTIYVRWEMDKTKYNTRLEYRLKDSEEWIEHGLWEREVNPIFDVPNPFLVVPFVENIEFLRLINIDRVTGQESLPTLYSYEEDTEIGEVDIDPGDNPFIPDELKQDEMSLDEAISHANEYLKEGMNSLTFMGQVYEILPSPIPEAIAFVIVLSIALLIIKIVRG